MARKKSELETFDGLDNRKDIMLLLKRLGGDRQRAVFLESLLPLSFKGFAACPVRITGPCNEVSAYFLMVGICNELGVPINEAAKRLEKEVRNL